MKILITGISGFVGSHFVEFIQRNFPSYQIHGTMRRRSDLKNIEHLMDKITLHECDLTDSHSLDTLFRSNQFERCFHLAAQSHVPTSWIRPIETMNINANGVINLLESVRNHNKNCRVLICGSSEEYGLVHESEAPITENNPLRPLSPYAASKVAADFTGYVYFKSYGLHIVRTRAFNHEGFRRPEDFILGKLTKQAVEIELGKREYFELGNLEAKRDITDVRDIVEAYWLVLEKGVPGEVYNICSGRTYSIKELLELVSSIANVSPKVRQDPRYLRPADVPLLLGNCSKFEKVSGWKRKFDMPSTITDMLQYWRAKLSTQPITV